MTTHSALHIPSAKKNAENKAATPVGKKHSESKSIFFPSAASRYAGHDFNKISIFHSESDSYEQEADHAADKISRAKPVPHSNKENNKFAIQFKRNVAEPAHYESSKIPLFVRDVIHAPGQPLNNNVRSQMEHGFGQNFSNVRIHTNEKAAQSAHALQAQAYTVGNHIAFASGHYAPDTAEGTKLIAHELTHTIQQSKSGYKIQRRRVPAGAGLDTVLPASGSDSAAHMEGLRRIIRRAWDSLNAAQRAQVKTAASAFGISGATDVALFTALSTATRTQLLRFSNEIRLAAPTLELGDPALINVGPRPATTDTANLNTLVSNANAKFTTIASGTRDADIRAVFGTANLASAKTKYANAKAAMNRLKTANKIVTDRSGYNAEVSLGGLTNSSQISVSPTVIDNPNDNESIVTLIHESMHAGNNDVRDFGYIHLDPATFTSLSEAIKLTNAAHFEVVPRRMMSMSFSFTGQTFVPAGTSSTPALTPKQQAIRNASEEFRAAWTAALNLHTLFVRVFRNPSEWNTLDLATQFSGAASGSKFSNTLPFWSKVEALTVHNRPSINATAGNPATNPVTLIDVSLSEGLTRKLARSRVPQSEAAALTFETTHATPAELVTISLGVNFEAEVLITLVLRAVTGNITGSTGRDFQVVKRMAQANRASNFTDMLQIRTPSAFPF